MGSTIPDPLIAAPTNPAGMPEGMIQPAYALYADTCPTRAIDAAIIRKLARIVDSGGWVGVRWGRDECDEESKTFQISTLLLSPCLHSPLLSEVGLRLLVKVSPEGTMDMEVSAE